MIGKNLAVVLAGIGLLCGCSMSWSGANCASGTGDPIKKTISVAEFNGISVEGSIDVHIVKGNTQLVEVVGQPELIALLNTDVQHGVWKIGTNECFNTAKEFAVYITTNLLSSLATEGSGDIHSADVFGSGTSTFSVAGSGDIVVTGVNDKVVNTEIAGSGSITLNGTCTEFEAGIAGSGDVHAQGLSANTVEAMIDGSGGVDITAISELNAEINGSGTIRYRGKPQVTSDVNGSGAVVPFD
jgi:Putative auto-transporter adhesin, head GIN domain